MIKKTYQKSTPFYGNAISDSSDEEFEKSSIFEKDYIKKTNLVGGVDEEEIDLVGGEEEVIDLVGGEEEIDLVGGEEEVIGSNEKNKNKNKNKNKKVMFEEEEEDPEIKLSSKTKDSIKKFLSSFKK